MSIASIPLFWLPAALAAQAPVRPPASPFLPVRDQVRAEFSADRALATTAFVAQYWRVVGNTGFNASIARLAAILDSAGFVPEDHAAAPTRLTYRIEHRAMSRPTWEPVDGSLTIVGQPAPILRYATNHHMLGMYSVSTPRGGVEAELVDVGKGTAADFATVDVAGRIVLGESSLRNLWTEAVRKRGALGVLAYSMPAYTRPEVNRSSIQFTGIPYDSAHTGWGIPLSLAARAALRAALARGPVRVRAEIATRLYRSEELTLIAEVRGSRVPAERFVFSAHVQEPGANDNASGTGALAEMARVTATLVRSGRQDPARTITFLWGEEIGSTARFLKEDSARARGVRWGMSLDMVGEDVSRTGGTFLIEKMPDPSAVWTRGDDHHTEWGGSPLTVEQLTPHYFNDFVRNRCLDQAEGTGWVVKTNPFEGGSDHTPFLDAGKPGLLLWHFTDQFYHTDGDRIGMVSAPEIRNVGVCALTTALALGSADAKTAVRVVAEIRQAALERLEREAALSVAAVRQQSTRD
ncbi:MAG TPA: M28 family peptidase, partial [Gemmatimonadales bacterium]|nr:M28 family peptidase [Gemmatimonadales bacterium]